MVCDFFGTRVHYTMLTIVDIRFLTVAAGHTKWFKSSAKNGKLPNLVT